MESKELADANILMVTISGNLVPFLFEEERKHTHMHSLLRIVVPARVTMGDGTAPDVV